ncbi:Fibronectin type III domain-containing protein [Micromonospora pattaloongensis]|uniref:Fibronectin type III domain-containing protein n=1 Tax=Micromonospora pattaloongensis TaxID=405436 RepID=A0A1H3HMU7_9ACTN|nr:fibronectin type III domain-containing protein [Micromonospora pattaloongensis]SDY16545.1 Fibronectin type III domain-containing protein [Micromonospora pattaloongensis]
MHTARPRRRAAGRLRSTLLAAALSLFGSVAVVATTAAPAFACHGMAFANEVKGAAGYTVEVTTIFAGANGITVSANPGTVTISGTSWETGQPPLIATVTGLTPGQASILTVNANLLPSGTACTTYSGSALEAAAAAPALGAATRTADGFTFAITNFNATRYSYAITATNDAQATVDEDGLVTVTGLAAGGSATVTVTATANEGSGYTGTASASRTGRALGGDPEPPAAPAKPTVVAGDSAAKITWVAPATNGAAITGYVVTASPGGATCTAKGNETSCVIAGLSNGTPYTFKVLARSAAGDSAASPASDPRTPAPTTNKDLSIDRPTVEPGGTVTLVAEGYRAGTRVDFYLHSDPVFLGSAVANASGVATLTADLPQGVTGGHTARAIGTGLNGLPLSQDIAVTITASGSGGGDGLPKTGDRLPFGMIGLAAGLLLAGLALLFVARQRNSATNRP